MFTAQRLYTDGLSTISRWSGPKGFLCFGLEPGAGRAAHPGIPAGTYPLKLRTVGAKHGAYLKRFGPLFHKGMVQIDNVPGRSEIEFHIGNTIDDTQGCTLCGEKMIAPRLSNSQHWEVGSSLFAYQAVYPVLRDAILAGRIFLEILPVGSGLAEA